MASLTQKQRAQLAARHVMMARLSGQVVRRRKIPKQTYPKLIEAEYAAAVLHLLQPVGNLIKHVMTRLPRLVAAGRKAHLDATDNPDTEDPNDEFDDVDPSDDAPEQVDQLVDNTKSHIAMLLSAFFLLSTTRKFATRTTEHAKAELDKQVKAAFGTTIPTSNARIPVIEDTWARQAAENIKLIPAVVLDRIRVATTKAIQGQMTMAEYRALLNEIFLKQYENRIRNMSRNDIGTAYGQLNRDLQRELGITQFNWETMQDERVRPLHEHLGLGGPYNWDNPETEGEGIPGEPDNCRCYAAPIFDSIKGEE